MIIKNAPSHYCAIITRHAIIARRGYQRGPDVDADFWPFADAHCIFGHFPMPIAGDSLKFSGNFPRIADAIGISPRLFSLRLDLPMPIDPFDTHYVRSVRTDPYSSIPLCYRELGTKLCVLPDFTQETCGNCCFSHVRCVKVWTTNDRTLVVKFCSEFFCIQHNHSRPIFTWLPSFCLTKIRKLIGTQRVIV